MNVLISPSLICPESLKYQLVNKLTISRKLQQKWLKDIVNKTGPSYWQLYLLMLIWVLHKDYIWPGNGTLKVPEPWVLSPKSILWIEERMPQAWFSIEKYLLNWAMLESRTDLNKISITRLKSLLPWIKKTIISKIIMSIVTWIWNSLELDLSLSDWLKF